MGTRMRGLEASPSRNWVWGGIVNWIWSGMIVNWVESREVEVFGPWLLYGLRSVGLGVKAKCWARLVFKGLRREVTACGSAQLSQTMPWTRCIRELFA